MTITEPQFVEVKPPQQPAANEAQTALLEWAAANPTDRPTPARDGNGRYRLPHPDTNKATSWTRATTFAGSLSDSEGLNVWRHRLLVGGLASSPDLVASAAAAWLADDRQALTRAAGQALHRGGEKLAADVGTAMHTAFEHYVAGNNKYPPHPYDLDLVAVTMLLGNHGISLPPEWSERILLTPDIGVAGTTDNIITLDGINYIADLKTGSSADRIDYAIQLAIYAHAAHMWKLDGTGYEPMPEVDQNTAYIIHAPAGTGTAELVAVDIATGWELAMLCQQIRAGRTTKGLFVTVKHPDAIHAERVQWITERVATIKADHPELKDMAGEQWRASGIAATPPWTTAEVDTLSAILHGLESAFPAADPRPPPAPPAKAEPAAPRPLPTPADDGAKANAEDVTGLRAAITGLAEDQQRIAMLTYWAKQGNQHQRPWDDASDGMTVRCWNVARAALRLIICLGPSCDQKARAVIAYALADDLDPTWATGAVLGSLTTEQAEQVAQFAGDYRSGDALVRSVVDAVVGAP